MRPDQSQTDRFAHDLDGLIAPGARLGVAVSGGPDSLALLLLAATARPALVEAATIDHGFRAEGRDEAEMVAGVCERLGVPHAILTARWPETPTSAIQERARHERYRLLGYWAEERGLAALATAHHADDQAETVVMRFARGSGVRGLAGMRPKSGCSVHCWAGAVASSSGCAPLPD
jgi:tRNA(Ile)-lysidine synthase